MSDTLETLCDHMQIKRRKWQGHGQASITVEYDGIPPRPDRYVACVVVDGQDKAFLVGTQPRGFRLKPGEHRITVYFGEELRLTWLPRVARVELRIMLEPGAHIELVCGMNPRAADSWKSFRDRFARTHVRLLLVSFSLLPITWAACKVLQIFSPLVAIREPFPGRVLFSGQLTEGTPWLAAVFVFNGFCAIWMAAEQRRCWNAQRAFRARFAVPYFVRRKSEANDADQSERC